MRSFASGAGLTPKIPTPPPGSLVPEDVITDEAGVQNPDGQNLRVVPLAEEEEMVAQGAPVAELRGAPGVNLVAPMPGRVARISLLPGRKLSEIVLFHEVNGAVKKHGTSCADTENGLRDLLQSAGLWTWLRRRPFGGIPATAERPAAIVVMAIDTRPLAPDPREALFGREEAFARGVEALTALTDGPVFVCLEPGRPLFEPRFGKGRVRVIECGLRHPQGSPGIRVHDLAPATTEMPVWDVHAEDVAALGEFLETGVLSMMRHVTVTGPALRESRRVRAQPGADIRELVRRFVTPGEHVLISGSALDGHEAHWLAPRHRQVTVLPRETQSRRQHWLVAALTRSAGPKPIIPTAALSHAFGGGLPAAPFVRALSSGDDETAMKLGVLSLLEEDVALADYVLGGDAHLAQLLRGMLDRIEVELAA